MRPLRGVVAHPALMGIFPAAALLAHNLDQVKLSAAWRSLAVSLVFALILWGITSFATRDKLKAAMITTWFLVLFFSYGHVYDSSRAIEFRELEGIIRFSRHRYQAPIWLFLLAGGIWWIVRTRSDLARATIMLNLMGTVALAMPLAQIALFQVKAFRTERVLESAELLGGASPLTPPETDRLPDIYYIILDAYAREDKLVDLFGYDNSPFLVSLRDKGFFVADCSLANYAQTELSLASSLNLDYLDNLGDKFTQGNDDRSPLWPLIRRSTVRRLLEETGYLLVAFETGFYWTQLEDAEHYFGPNVGELDRLRLVGALNGFEAMLVRSSAVSVLAYGIEELPDILRLDLDHGRRDHRERVLFTLDKLGDLPSIPGPKFVFAHVVSPHGPFVFGPEGEFVDDAEFILNEGGEGYATGYRDQVTFLNSRVVPTIGEIISESSTPPIIILQSDHGSDYGSREDRMSILNAYYLPAGGGELLYPSISPINSFRIVLNAVFDAGLPLLRDVSYFSTFSDPYDFTIIPNDCRAD